MNGSHLALTQPLLWWQILLLVGTLIGLVIAFTRLRQRFLHGAAKDRNADVKRLWLRILLLATGLGCLGVALRHPEMGQYEETVVRQGLDIMLLVDVSRSMLAEDVAPSRLEAAKRKIIDLTQLLRGERLSLVPFSGTAFVQCPLTSDYDALRLFLDLLTTDLLPRGGSHLAEAVAVALKSLKDTPDEKRRGSAILIFSDGEDLSGGMEQVAQEAAKMGVRIFAFGIGTESGAPIPLNEGGFQQDGNGRMVVTKRDGNALAELTSKTGGKYWPMEISDQDILAFRDLIGKDANLASSEERKTVGKPVFQYFIFLALLCLLLEGSMLSFPLLRKIGLAGWVIIGLGLCCITRPLLATTQEAQKAFDRQAFEESATLYREAAKSGGAADARAQYNAGVAAFKAGKMEEAEAAFDAATRSEEKKLKAEAWYNKGVTAAKRGQADKARDAFKQALSFNPDDREAKENFDALKKQQEQKKPQEQQKDSDKEKSEKQKESQEKDKKQDGSNGKDQSQQDEKKDGSEQKQASDPTKPDDAKAPEPKSGKSEEDSAEPQQQAAAEAAKEEKAKNRRNQQIDRILEGIPDRGQPEWYAPAEEKSKQRQTNDVDKDW